MQPHQQTTSQSHKSFFQFFLICNFFFFAEALWGFILPPAVSLSRILWELDLRSRKEPPLRIAKKSLIVSWWSWWESHPCLKSYWTTSLPLLTEGISSVIFSRCGVWKPLGKPLPHYKWQSHSRISYLQVLKEKLYEHPCTSISRVLSLRTSHESSSPLWKCNHRVFPYLAAILTYPHPTSEPH